MKRGSPSSSNDNVDSADVLRGKVEYLNKCVEKLSKEVADAEAKEAELMEKLQDIPAEERESLQKIIHDGGELSTQVTEMEKEIYHLKRELEEKQKEYEQVARDYFSRNK
ncbi:hypothetical protein O6P43_000760 [Quillaja saponaria]|uniref:Uncharacterized protein n=1 Tax=Quillaja saponaria TaxID=32244 RepID=A0AAD7QHG7_QUISA|nr:hypothetical protein O6P43_000760 [Quillaja saponaria]